MLNTQTLASIAQQIEDLVHLHGWSRERVASSMRITPADVVAHLDAARCARLASIKVRFLDHYHEPPELCPQPPPARVKLTTADLPTMAAAMGLSTKLPALPQPKPELKLPVRRVAPSPVSPCDWKLELRGPRAQLAPDPDSRRATLIELAMRGIRPAEIAKQLGMSVGAANIAISQERARGAEIPYRKPRRH